MADLFTYGTLMDAEIMNAVCGHQGTAEPAYLKHYQCKQVKNEQYPGVIAKPMKQTQGLLYRNVSDVALAKLDEFEGEQYRREIVTLHLANGKRQPAFCYIWLNELRSLISTQDWSFENFLIQGKEKFCAEYVGFKR